MKYELILEGTDGVGKTTTAELLRNEGIPVSDRNRDVICKYMLFHIDMETRVAVYEKFLRENDVLVIFMVNHNEDEITRRIYSRERISEFDKQANEYNRLYTETYRYMEERKLTHGKLLLADCTDLTLSAQAEMIKDMIKNR